MNADTDQGLLLCAAKHPEHKYVDPMTGQVIEQTALKKVSSLLTVSRGPEYEGTEVAKWECLHAYRSLSRDIYAIRCTLILSLICLCCNLSALQ
jgi:hypothetical protein